MPQDNRYTVVRILIEGGHITTFKQIFEYIPPTVVAKDYGSNYVRFMRPIKNPSNFRLKDIKILASLFQVDSMKMIELIYNQNKSSDPNLKRKT
jgi:hypothetical protein